ncbi:MAG TPA: hypothetical protein VII92_14760 [Anaerolineae bacterium]
MFEKIRNVLKNKRGMTGKFEKYFVAIIGLVVLFVGLGTLYPTAVAAGDTLNASGIPFGSFFASGGIVWLVLAAGLLYAAFKGLMHKGGSKY